MRKCNYLLIAALIIVTTAATILVGCKKEKDEMTPNAKKNTETQALLNCIRHFQVLREACNSGIKSEGSMALVEMRQTLGLVANYEHSEHETRCKNTTLDTLYVAMPIVDINGNVSNVDVVAVYNGFEKALQERMENIDDGRNIPSLFSIILPQVGTKDGDDIRFIFTRGEESDLDPDSPTVNGPIEDLCLVWGLDLGYCDPAFLNIVWDAADELSTYFTPNDTNPGNGAYHVFEDVEYVEYIATNTFMVPNPYASNYSYKIPPYAITPCDDWLFYQSGVINGPEPCLCEDEMNCEWYSINTFIVDDDGEWHNSPTYDSPYYYCVVKDNVLRDKTNNDVICDRYHTARVCYARHHWVGPID